MVKRQANLNDMGTLGSVSAGLVGWLVSRSVGMSILLYWSRVVINSGAGKHKLQRHANTHMENPTSEQMRKNSMAAAAA